MNQIINNQRKQLQDLMSDNSWQAMDWFIDDFLTKRMGEVRIDNKWDFTKDSFMREGGIFHIKRFFSELEKEAKQYK